MDVEFTHSAGGEGRARSSSRSSCPWRVIRIDAFEGLAPDPDRVPYLVQCGAGPSSIWWAPKSAPAAVAGVVEQVLRRVDAAPVLIGSAPPGPTVAGLPTYFWAGVGTLAWRDAAFGLDVQVGATVGSVTWDFGDGTPELRGDLGEAWPAGSSIRHAYRDAGVYEVTVTVELLPVWAANGVPQGALAPIEVSATREVQVDQIQAVRTR